MYADRFTGVRAVRKGEFRRQNLTGRAVCDSNIQRDTRSRMDQVCCSEGNNTGSDLYSGEALPAILIPI